MSYLNRLIVQGVRSFGSDDGDAAAITFSTPLTLILGENGCGKTTLIESLKYATSGDLPLNSKNGSGFVHDPKVFGNVETRANIRLSINDVKGNRVDVLKIMQTLQKQKKLQFSSVDQVITVYGKDGKKINSTGKCVDINNEICIALGVSKAILNSVIFCHQEESNWPLEEGSKLKERFDAIFDSVKYNKCLDHIRKMKKEHSDKLKIMKGEIKYLLEYKETASRKRASLEGEESRLASCKDNVKSLKEKLRPVQERLQELVEKEDHISKIHTKHETLKVKLEGIKSTIRDYKGTIQYEFSGTKNELIEAINNFHEELKNKQGDIENLERQEETIIREQKRHQQLISDEQRKLGQLARDFEKNQEKIETRNGMMTKLCGEVNVVATMSQLSDLDEAARVLYMLDKAIIDAANEEKKIRSEQEAKIENLQQDINSLLGRKSKLEQSLENKQTELAKNRAEARKVKTDIEEVDQSAEKLGLLQSSLDRIKKSLEELSQSTQMDDLEKQIKEAEKERDMCEDKLTLIEKEIQQLQSLSSLQAQLDVQKEEKSKKETEIRKLKSRHEDSLKHLLKRIPEQGIKYEFQSFMEKLSDDIKSKKDKTKSLSNQISSLESERKHLSEKLQNAKQSLSSDESIISQACCGKDFDSYLSELSNELQDLQDRKGIISSSEFMFRRYIQKLQQREPCCPLCDRNFSAEEDVTQLISKLTLKVKELPSKLRSKKQQLDSTQEKYNHLLQLKPKHERLSVIKNIDIPELESELSSLEEKLESLEEELAIIQAELVGPQADESLAKTIQGDVVLLEQYITDSRLLSREIQRLEAKLPTGSGSRSLKESMNEQKELRLSLQVLRRNIDSCQEKRNNLSSRKHQLQEEKNSVQDQQMKISGNVQMRSQLSERRNELDSLEAIIVMEIEKGREDLADISRLHNQTCRKKESLIKTNHSALEILTNKNRKLEQRYELIKKANLEIQEYKKSGGSEKLNTAKTNLETLEIQNDSLQSKKEVICGEKEKLKTHLATQTVRERELDDNLKLRQKMEEEKELNHKIDEMKINLGNLDYKSLHAEKNKLRTEEEKINRERALSEGRQKELEHAINGLKAELNKEQLKSADKNYRDKIIDIKVGEMAADDMGKYFTAMDWALMYFHKEKMRSINKIINELWRNIYRGNDIDTIAIKTDEEGVVSVDKKRTYNYRVVQEKNGVELDMRGRCSAGQKVLACLIIRMALAETFSPHCGVLALDEPTTNLDENNIDSLGQALANMVLKRMKQKNFQLIVITHDKNFMDILTRIDQITHYFEVKRDNRGKSVIEKVIIREEEDNSPDY